MTNFYRIVFAALILSVCFAAPADAKVLHLRTKNESCLPEHKAVKTYCTTDQLCSTECATALQQNASCRTVNHLPPRSLPTKKLVKLNACPRKADQ